MTYRERRERKAERLRSGPRGDSKADRARGNAGRTTGARTTQTGVGRSPPDPR